MTKEYSVARRNFLKTVAAAAGIAACLPRTTKAITESKAVVSQTGEVSQGYRETQHISKYYQTARN